MHQYSAVEGEADSKVRQNNVPPAKRRGPSFRRVLTTIAIALPTLAGIGCRHSAPPLDNRFRLALSPATFQQSISLQQHVEVQQAGKSVEFDAVLDVNPEEVTLVGLAFSQRVFTLKYNGVKLEESRSRMLPREVQAADVLSDLQLALWPVEAVRAALPAGWTLRDSPSERVLSQGDTVRTSISYSATPPWIGNIMLTNKQYDYRLFIKSAVAQ
ncbi:MAG: DUF3261 domain-containing protein [Gemmatimonadaceae bacterium]